MTMPLEIAKLADILRLAAKEEILPRFRRLGSGDVRSKSEPSDLVTEADEAAERLIRRELEALAPDALFVGEESVAADPSLLAKLGSSDFAIVVDPVDGTFNFASGIPAFGVMASVVWKGETVAGIIYDPMGDDWVMAEKGGGAWLRRPSGEAVRLQVAAALPLPEMVGTASVAFMPEASRGRVLNNFTRVRMVANYRVAGHEYRTFASGHTQFVCFNKLMPWDHLPGVLISQEAGAYAARLDGSAYLPSHVDGGLLVAIDRASWDALRRDVFTF